MSISFQNPPTTEFDLAFDLAKKALGFVGKYQTPPTPKVYEVWYRYAENRSDPIRERIDHLINQTDSVDVEALEEIYDQFCSEPDAQTAKIGSELSQELSEFKSLLSSQIHAGEEFNSKISSASNTLGRDAGSDEDIKKCVTQLLENNQRMQTQLQATREQLHESQNQVENLRKGLDDSQRKIMTDPLTGVGNRRFFDNTLLHTSQRASCNDSSTFLLLIDLDEFKGINDTYGHAIGDEVLKFVAEQFQRLGGDAKVARHGGDEFAIFLEVEESSQATEFAERLRKACITNKLKLTHSGESLGRIGISIGVARLRPDDDQESWFNRADQLLYRAKNSGRNCVMAERVLDRH